jgi:hypothetical protein
MLTPRDKYTSDSDYHTMVDLMVSLIDECRFTPSEMREMAIFASIIYEENRLEPRVIRTNPNIEKALKDLYDWATKL